MKDFPSATDTALFTSQETSILEDPYRKEVLLDNWAHERKKTKYALFSVGLVLLIFNLVGATTAGISITDNLGALVLFPALFIGLGFFAHLQPMIAVIGGVLVI